MLYIPILYIYLRVFLNALYYYKQLVIFRCFYCTLTAHLPHCAAHLQPASAPILHTRHASLLSQLSTQFRAHRLAHTQTDKHAHTLSYTHTHTGCEVFVTFGVLKFATFAGTRTYQKCFDFGRSAVKVNADLWTPDHARCPFAHTQTQHSRAVNKFSN